MLQTVKSFFGVLIKQYVRLTPCSSCYRVLTYISGLFLTVYPEEFLPTYQNINEGETLSKPQLVSLHSDVELTYSNPPHPPMTGALNVTGYSALYTLILAHPRARKVIHTVQLNISYSIQLNTIYFSSGCSEKLKALKSMWRSPFLAVLLNWIYLLFQVI